METEAKTVRPEASPYKLGPSYKHRGRVEVHEMYRELDTETVLVNVLYFDADSRSRPHTHDTDQILYFVNGPGVIAIGGGEDRLVDTGEFILLPANVPHMHGAPASGPAAHISLMPPGHVNDFDCAIPDHWQHWRDGRGQEQVG
jgi:quercetin dioxygenase-like cupin family protein